MRKKPGPVARARAKKRRKEGPVVKAVRAKCVDRDGYCRHGKDDELAGYYCEGYSQWAHFGEKKRFKTRGMAPEERHTTTDSLMLCEACHTDYDHGDLIIVPMTEDGCDGELSWAVR